MITVEQRERPAHELHALAVGTDHRQRLLVAVVEAHLPLGRQRGRLEQLVEDGDALGEARTTLVGGGQLRSRLAERGVELGTPGGDVGDGEERREVDQ